MKNQTLTYNWHFTERCNYACKFCFAHWEDNKKRSEEIFNDPQQIDLLLQNLHQGLTLIKNSQNQPYQNLRLNLVGGEPFLYLEQMEYIAAKAKEYGFLISIVTNGSFLHQERAQKFVLDYIDQLGISIDSTNQEINREIGRCGRTDEGSKTFLNVERLGAIIKNLCQQKPSLNIKVNTVVNCWNKDDDMTDAIKLLKPTRWKVFKVLNNINDAGAITEAQFHDYVQRHKLRFGHIMAVENNDAMSSSYLMIDPKGRLFQNDQDKLYNYSDPITTIGLKLALTQIHFSISKYEQRYVPLVELPTLGNNYIPMINLTEL